MAHITFAQSYGLIKPREGWERSCLDGYPWAQLKFRIYNYRVLCPSPLVIQFLNLYVTQKFPWLCFHLIPIPPSDSDSVTITRVGYLVGVPPPGMFPSSSWSDNSPAHFLCPQSSWWWQDRGRGLGAGRWMWKRESTPLPCHVPGIVGSKLSASGIELCLALDRELVEYLECCCLNNRDSKRLL